VSLYGRLGLSKTATDDDVRKAFRRLSQQYHPDKPGGSEALFKQISEAYQTLGDKDRRALYDEFGDESLSVRFNATAARAAKAARERPFGGFPTGGQGDVADLLKDMFGKTHKPFHAGARVSGYGPIRQVYATEQTIDFASAIQGCHLRVTDNVLFWEVDIPPGTSDGESFRFQHMSSRTGDLILTVHVTPHPCFHRYGDNLSVDVNVTVGELYHGAQVPVPSPRGGGVLTIAPRTPSGTVMRVAGHGVGRNGVYGDLFVRWVPVVPMADGLASAVDELSRHTEAGIRDNLRL
jgi:curved DNA-binding protein